MDFAAAQITAISLLAKAQVDAKAPLTQPQILGIMASCNDTEIAAARVARKHSRNGRVREFASHIADDHHRLNQELDELARRLGATPWLRPAEPELVGSPALDRSFIKDQQEADRVLLEGIDDVLLPGAQDPGLADALRRTRDMVERHYSEALEIE